MPVHDAMYTYALADQLMGEAAAAEAWEIYDRLETVKKEAFEASKESARVVREFFGVLEDAVNSNDTTLAKKAKEIYSGPYYLEIA